MFQGFYNLSASMLTHTRKLNVVSNNMANVTTTGFRGDKTTIKSFDEEMVYRSSDKSQDDAVAIGLAGSNVGIGRNYTDFTQGGIEPSTSNLDVALLSEGFFTIQMPDGEQLYTRNGSFSLDGEGYLAINGLGRVMGENGEILIGHDDITVDSEGQIYTTATDELIDALAIVNFDDYHSQLTKKDNNLFAANVEATPYNAVVVHKAVEGSNVNSVKELSEMMSSSRNLQSSAQIMQIYDNLMNKIVNDIGLL